MIPHLTSLFNNQLAKLTRTLLTTGLVAMALGAGLVAGPVLPARAATYDVNIFIDLAPNGCQQPPAGDCSLREAIIDANLSLGTADTINLPAGSYSLTQTGAGEDNAATGDLDIRDDLTIAGTGATIDATGSGDRVFHVIGADGLPVVSMSGVTITGGLEDTGGGLRNDGGHVALTSTTVINNHASGSSGNGGGLYNIHGDVILIDSTVEYNSASSLTAIENGGGGIYNAYANLSIHNSTINRNFTNGTLDNGGGLYNWGASAAIYNSFFTANTASQPPDLGPLAGNGGGAIYNEYGGAVSLINSTLSGNTAVAPGLGGGLYNGLGLAQVVGGWVIGNSAWDGGGLMNEHGTLTVTDAIVDGNTAADVGGGVMNRLAVLSTDPGLLTIADTLIANNTAEYGGGVVTAGGTAVLDRLEVRDNAVTNRGGGIYHSGSGTTTLSDSLVSANVSDYQGGGLFSEGDLILNHVVVDGNTALMGGGIATNAGGAATLNNSTVSGNTAQIGGGITQIIPADVVVLNSSTVTANTATTLFGTGGIYSFGTVIARNSIIAAQTLGRDCALPITSSGYNLESGTSCGFTAAGDLQSTNPLLLPLAGNGGPTQTHALQGSSPAVDAGSPAGCQGDLNGDGVLEMLATDQRGQARVDMPGTGNAPPAQVCDIGAYEYVPLLANGSFEDDLDGNGIPDGWAGSNLGQNDGQTCTQPAHSGPCRFNLRANANGTKKTLYQVMAHSGQAGDSYTVAVWATANNAVGGNLKVRVEFYDASGAAVGGVNLPLTLGTYGWQQFTTGVVAPAGYDTIGVALISTLTGGRAAFDDITLVQN
jgi:hypothetical protein